MTREDAVRQLLSTQFDYLLHGRTEFASQPGAAPSKKRCAECGGMGKKLVYDRATGSKRFKLCVACGGQRWVSARKNEEAEDPYLVEKTDKNQTVLVTQDKRETMTMQEIEHELGRIADSQIERGGGVGRFRDPRDAHDRTGSYRALRIALEALKDQRPTLSEVLTACYSHEERQGGLGVRLGLLEAEAVSWLAERMPKEIRVPGETVESEQRKTIREYFEAGWKLRRIARELHLDLRTVKRAVSV